jgi:hypothetical protein
MCMACEMEAMWFAAMEARVSAAEAVPQPEALLPPLEKGKVGEGIAGGTGGVHGESADPHPNPAPEEGGRGAPAPRFACDETPAE